MKKFIKNILLSFIIVYSILNLLLFVNFMILKSSMLREVVGLYLSEDRDIEACVQLEQDTLGQINEIKELYGEEVPATGLVGIRQLMIGVEVITGHQLGILIMASILGVAIGTIIHLKEESKMKEILYFVVIGIIFILICMGYSYVMGEFRDTNIFEAFGETIDIYGLWYIIGYMLVYIFRIYKDKKKVKELNKELENKNK